MRSGGDHLGDPLDALTGSGTGAPPHPGDRLAVHIGGIAWQPDHAIGDHAPGGPWLTAHRKGHLVGTQDPHLDRALAGAVGGDVGDDGVTVAHLLDRLSRGQGAILQLPHFAPLLLGPAPGLVQDVLTDGGHEPFQSLLPDGLQAAGTEDAHGVHAQAGAGGDAADERRGCVRRDPHGRVDGQGYGRLRIGGQEHGTRLAPADLGISRQTQCSSQTSRNGPQTGQSDELGTGGLGQWEGVR